MIPEGEPTALRAFGLVSDVLTERATTATNTQANGKYSTTKSNARREGGRRGGHSESEFALHAATTNHREG